MSKGLSLFWSFLEPGSLQRSTCEQAVIQIGCIFGLDESKKLSWNIGNRVILAFSYTVICLLSMLFFLCYSSALSLSHFSSLKKILNCSPWYTDGDKNMLNCVPFIYSYCDAFPSNWNKSDLIWIVLYVHVHPLIAWLFEELNGYSSLPSFGQLWGYHYLHKNCGGFSVLSE